MADKVIIVVVIVVVVVIVIILFKSTIADIGTGVNPGNGLEKPLSAPRFHNTMMMQ